MNIVGILLQAALYVALALGLFHVIRKLVQIPGNRKITRIYPEESDEEARASNKAVIWIIAAFFYVVSTILLIFLFVI